MNMDFEHIEVQNNEGEQRYEVSAQGHTAMLLYERDGSTLTLVHTEVPPAMEGHGIASKLARTALEDARAQQLSVIPLCQFVASYIRRHPEYLSLLPEAEQERLQETT